MTGSIIIIYFLKIIIINNNLKTQISTVKVSVALKHKILFSLIKT